MKRPMLSLAVIAAAPALSLPALADDPWQPVVKETAAATAPASALQPDDAGALTPMSDLDNIWSLPFWIGAAGTPKETGLAVASGWGMTGLPPNLSFAEFSYTLVKQRRADGYYDALVLKLDSNGSPLTQFGDDGWKQFSLPNWDGINAATFGAESAMLGVDYTRVYFAGLKLRGSFLDTDMAVLCLDLTTVDGRCAGWPSGSVVYVAFDHGGLKADSAQTITFDPDGFLYVAGKIASDNGYAIGVAKLNAADGSLDTSFSDDGKARYALNGYAYAPEITASTITPADHPNGKYLYLAGSYESFANNRDGLILRINPANASYYQLDVHLDDTLSPRSDEITALTLLRNGKIAFAGWSQSDDAAFPKLLLGRVSATLFLDAGFCGGGLCGYVQAPSNPQFGGTQWIRPSAIGERAGNRDLVIAYDGWQRPPFTNDAYTKRQFIALWNSTGTQRRAGYSMTYSAAPDEAPEATAAGLAVDHDQILLTGSRRWNAGDSDATVSRFLGTDSIFADQFGGDYGD